MCEAYGNDEETGQHGIPLSGMWFTLIHVFCIIYLLKVAWCSAVVKKDGNGERARDVLGTKEKSDSRGKSDGRRPGIFHGSKQCTFARGIRRQVDVQVYGVFPDRLSPW